MQYLAQTKEAADKRPPTGAAADVEKCALRTVPCAA